MSRVAGLEGRDVLSVVAMMWTLMSLFEFNGGRDETKEVKG